MDVADMASEHEQRWLAHQIAAARQSSKALHQTGRCHNCDDELTGAKLFCDQDCRQDYERRTTRAFVPDPRR